MQVCTMYICTYIICKYEAPDLTVDIILMKKLEKCSKFSKLEGGLHCIILVAPVLIMRHLK